MKKILFVLLIASGVLVACDKTDTLPEVSTSPIFSVSSVKHTKDTVNLGDSIYFTVMGKIADTTNTFTASIKLVSGSVSASTGAFTSSNIMVAAHYVKSVARVISTASGTSPLYNWTSVIGIPSPGVARKTNVLTTISIENSLSLSSQTGNQVVNDSKPVYIQ